MTADQLNFQVFTYVDDSATNWNKKGQENTAINAIDGSAAFTSGAPEWPKASRRYHTRRAVFYDPATFRTVSFVVYTPAAFAAIKAAPPTLALHIPGETATVNYQLSELIAEKAPIGKAARQLADHT